MKYWFLSIFLLVPTFAFSAEIYWYVAASMSLPGEAVVQHYNDSQDTHEAVLITGGSGQLISKIRASGRADLYLPASRHFFRQAQEYGLVQASAPLINLWPVFGLNPKSKSTYATLEDLGSPGTKLALGNPQTMALGALFERIEAKLPPELAAQLRRNTLVDSMNVQQNVSYLHQGIVDAALLFSSVAKANNFPCVEIPRRWNVAAQAVLVELTTSANPQAAADFASFVRRQEDIFRKYGFNVVQ